MTILPTNRDLMALPVTQRAELPDRSSIRTSTTRRRAGIPAGLVIAGAMLTTLSPRSAWADASAPDGLYQINFQDLMNVEVNSASRKEQTVEQVPSAIFVIAQDDIRVSGALNIPDLLRMVPGIEVAQINANTWAVSARGFNSQFSNKLLVLVDSRSVYTPTQDGVNWDTLDVPLETIDRIEVIRGPGATVWGSNAVNGVINIITKPARDTEGGLVTGGGGTHDREFATARYGADLPWDAAVRVFAKYLDDADYPDITGNDSDGWHLLHGGARLDKTFSAADSVTAQGDLYTGGEGSTIAHIVSIAPPVDDFETRRTILNGGNLFTRWSHTADEGRNTSLQLYFDRYYRSGPESSESRRTIDVDFSNQVPLSGNQDLVWGAELRVTDDQVIGTIDQAYSQARLSQQFVSAFFQDEVTWDHVSLYWGTKIEHTTFVSLVPEPSVRMAFTPSPRDTWWAAVSEADRTPARRDVDADINLGSYPLPNGAAAMSTLIGNPREKSEQLLSFESGYRCQCTERVSLDVAAFYNKYRDLRSQEPGPPIYESTPVPYVDYPIVFGNKVYGTTDGVEVSAVFRVAERWRLSPGYSLLHMDLRQEPSSLDTLTVWDTQGSSPRHQAELRSVASLPQHWSWTVFLAYVDRLPAQQVPAYARLDTRVSWDPTPRVELQLVGQNLLHAQHLESNDVLSIVNPSQITRSAYAQMTWKF